MLKKILSFKSIVFQRIRFKFYCVCLFAVKCQLEMKKVFLRSSGSSDHRKCVEALLIIENRRHVKGILSTEGLQKFFWPQMAS